MMSYKLSTSGLVLPSEASHLWRSDTSFGSDKTISATAQGSDFDRKDRIRTVACALLGYLEQEVLEDLSGAKIKRDTEAFYTVLCRLECAVRSTTDSFADPELDGRSAPFWKCWEFLVKGNNDEVLAAQKDWHSFMARELDAAAPQRPGDYSSERTFNQNSHVLTANPSIDIHTAPVELIIKTGPLPVIKPNQPARLTAKQMMKQMVPHSELRWAADRLLRGIKTGDYIIDDLFIEESTKAQLEFIINVTQDESWNKTEPGLKQFFMESNRWIREMPYEKVFLRLGMRDRLDTEALKNPGWNAVSHDSEADTESDSG